MAKSRTWVIKNFVCSNGQETFIIKDKPFSKQWKNIKMLAYEKIGVQKNIGIHKTEMDKTESSK